MCNPWDLDGDLLSKIDEYLDSTSVDRRPVEADGESESIPRSKKRDRGSVASIHDASSSCSDDSELSDNDNEVLFQPECIICSESFAEVLEIGIPMTCLHLFCYDCIKKWSNRTNVCPICKTEFTELRRILWKQFLSFVSSSGPRKLNRLRSRKRARIKNFKVLRETLLGCLSSIPSKVEWVPRKAPTDEMEDNFEGCEICGVDDNWEHMLLCDGCNLGFHMYCLDPPLLSIPQGDWYCKDCLESHAVQRGESSSILISSDVTSQGTVDPSSSQRRRNSSADGVSITPTTIVTRSRSRMTTHVEDQHASGHEDLFGDVDAPVNIMGRRELPEQRRARTLSSDLDSYSFSYYESRSRGNGLNSQQETLRTASTSSFKSIEEESSSYNQSGASTQSNIYGTESFGSHGYHNGSPRTSVKDILDTSLRSIGEYLNDTSVDAMSQVIPPLERFAFENSMASHNNAGSCDAQLDAGDTTVDGRSTSTVSFIYRYRAMMENNRSTRRIQAMQTSLTHSPTLKGLF
ncbi:PHD-finger domain-containing protein, putative [Babesia ovis]|uniref:PHD-finger domain-containing protein, putative n=1 Tax=Babesia ovis TaxID=5869 RepID=A0A9W5WV42_BABOV|nr:PHD-finger domain-containing protein, putative [Babesia ovis]